MFSIHTTSDTPNLYGVDNEQLFIELTSEAAANINGGMAVPVDTSNEIESGGAKIRVDLRPGLKDKNFTGKFESCNATFDDFNGKLNISCALSEKDINSGKILPLILNVPGGF